jgi:HSP20 family protein
MPEIIPMDRPMVSLRDAMDRLFAQSFTPFGAGPMAEVARPGAPANVWENEEGYHVWLLVPGLNTESIQITAQGGSLNISGEMSGNAPEGARGVHHEWSPSRFDRTVRLGTALESDKASATYRDGILKVYVPKAAHSRPRTIKVTTEA